MSLTSFCGDNRRGGDRIIMDHHHLKRQHTSFQYVRFMRSGIKLDKNSLHYLLHVSETLRPMSSMSWNGDFRDLLEAI
jgi:hypothetical protein